MSYYQKNKEFNRLFLKKEQKELYGKSFKNILYLGGILFITFLSLGFAIGSMKYLKRKMDDPFIKWINIEIPYVKANEIPRIKKELNYPAVKDSFQIQETNGYFQYTMYFMEMEGERQYQAMGRTIGYNNRILDKIGEKKNVFHGNVKFRESDIGIIITQDLLMELGYSRTPSYINMSYPVESGVYAPAPVPVIAVVDQLPGRSHFITTPYFYTKRFYSQFKPFNILDPQYANTLEYFIADSKENAELIVEELMRMLEKNREWSASLIDIIIQESNQSFRNGFLIRLIFDENRGENKSINNITGSISENKAFSANLVRVYSYNLSGNEAMRDRYDYLSIQFFSLDKIREFQKFVNAEYQLKIDMSNIESRENYNFVSKLTLIISIFLICFSILSIVFFIITLLKSHIEKIKMNLGTFKAFGLTNKSLIRIYVLMALKFLSIACAVAFLVAYFMGNTGFIRLILSVFRTTIEEQQNYFELLNWVSSLAITMILFINGIIVRYYLKGILTRTPGDLIYSRE